MCALLVLSLPYRLRCLAICNGLVEELGSIPKPRYKPPPTAIHLSKLNESVATIHQAWKHKQLCSYHLFLAKATLQWRGDKCRAGKSDMFDLSCGSWDLVFFYLLGKFSCSGCLEALSKLIFTKIFQNISKLINLLNVYY